MRAHRAGILAAAVLTVAGCGADPVASPQQVPTVATTSTPPPGTGLRVEQVAAGLAHPWDVGFLPDGRALVSQRGGTLTLVSGLAPGASTTDVAADLGDLYVASEGGLMGLAVYPDFASSRRFVTCQTHAEGGRPVDVRLITWTLAPDGRAATRADLLTGLPISSGRHSGCRPTFATDGALLVGTGDTARAAVSQDRTNLGGKLLRLDPSTGQGLPDNPFASSTDANERRVYGFGHRNVQGVAIDPRAGAIYTAEHGPTFDDEVNRVVPGGNYGWDPSKGGTDTAYDESVPMTDKQRFPDAIDAVWTSGKTTEAISGADFLAGPQWGALQNKLAVVALKGQKLLLLGIDGAGKLTDVTLPPEFDAKFGRLRTARQGPDGALYVTTDEGTDDKLLRVTRG